MWSPDSDKAKFFVETFCKISNLDDSGISLCAFPSRTYLKLNNIPVTLKLVRNVIKQIWLLWVFWFSLCSSGSSEEGSGSCEPELSCILAEFFNFCLNESWFSKFYKIWSVVAIFKNIWKTFATKNYRPVSLLFLVNEFFENNKLVHHLQKFGLFLISSMVSGILIQPHIFWELYLIELWGLLIVLGYSSCTTWYVQELWQDLAHWSFS